MTNEKGEFKRHDEKGRDEMRRDVKMRPDFQNIRNYMRPGKKRRRDKTRKKSCDKMIRDKMKT